MTFEKGYIIPTRTDEESIWQKKTNRRKSFLKMIFIFRYHLLAKFFTKPSSKLWLS